MKVDQDGYYFIELFERSNEGKYYTSLIGVQYVYYTPKEIGIKTRTRCHNFCNYIDNWYTEGVQRLKVHMKLDGVK